jgi:hypothetical protein
MTDERIETPAMTKSRLESPPTFLFVSDAVSIALSITICQVLMRILVGAGDPAEATIGRSPAKLNFSLVFSLMTFTPTALISSTVFVIAKLNRKWTALLPAVLLPLLGGIVVFFFLLGGLAT